MKGKVLDFNFQNGTGVISGDDGQRYNFTNADWKADQHPAVNQVVDFAIEENNAKEIYLDQASQAAAVPQMGEKSKIAAALLAFFLGGLGIHKFYLGCNTAGIIMLVVSILGIFLVGIPTLVIGVIAFIEFIIYLTKSDADFQAIYGNGQKCWF